MPTVDRRKKKKVGDEEGILCINFLYVIYGFRLPPFGILYLFLQHCLDTCYLFSIFGIQRIVLL